METQNLKFNLPLFQCLLWKREVPHILNVTCRRPCDPVRKQILKFINDYKDDKLNIHLNIYLRTDRRP